MKFNRLFLISIGVVLSGSVILALPMYLGGISVLRALFTGLNTATFLMYGWDKFSAQRGKVRIPETTLLLLAALGGTPGAFLCQELLRHKTRAYNFRRTFFLIAIVQLLLLLTVSMLIS